MIKHTLGSKAERERERESRQTAFGVVDTAEREPETAVLTVDYRTMSIGSAPAPDHVLQACPACGLPGARIQPEGKLGPSYFLHVVRIHATRERRKVAELEVCRQ